MGRREVLRGTAFLIMLVALIPASTVRAATFGYRSGAYLQQALRAITAAVGGGAEIGECLKTTARIREGDDRSWWREWSATAAERERAGDEALAQGRLATAAGEYFRASNYYRTAAVFLTANPSDPRIAATGRKGRDCFLKAAKLSPAPIIPVEIPYGETTLPGYLCLVDASDLRRPLLVLQAGLDGTAEELYFRIVPPARSRGYNCLLFEGPGQGRAIREQGLRFRPDWEAVAAPVVNFARERMEVDGDRIALWGEEFGGHLVARALAFERRPRAGVVNGGVYDLHAVVVRKPELERLLDDPAASRMVDLELYRRMKGDPALRRIFGNGMFAFGAKSPGEWMRLTRSYTLKSVAGVIATPMLVCDSEEDRDTAGQSGKLYAALSAPKTFLRLPRGEGAGIESRIAAQTLSTGRILDWLDGRMKDP